VAEFPHSAGVPPFFTLAGLGIVFNIYFTDTRNALIGTGSFLLGAPVFLLAAQAL